MKITTKQIVTAGVLMAVSVILSNPMFKIMGTIGLDAIPGYMGAAMLSPFLGGIIGGVAHLITALLAGFPYTPPVHLVVALTMFMSCFAYGYARNKTNRYVAIVVGIVMNGPVSLLISAYGSLMLTGFGGMPMFMALILPLTAASAVNVIFADILYGLVGSTLKKGLLV